MTEIRQSSCKMDRKMETLCISETKSSHMRTAL